MTKDAGTGWFLTSASEPARTLNPYEFTDGGTEGRRPDGARRRRVPAAEPRRRFPDRQSAADRLVGRKVVAKGILVRAREGDPSQRRRARARIGDACAAIRPSGALSRPRLARHADRGGRLLAHRAQANAGRRRCSTASSPPHRPTGAAVVYGDECAACHDGRRRRWSAAHRRARSSIAGVRTRSTVCSNSSRRGCRSRRPVRSPIAVVPGHPRVTCCTRTRFRPARVS